MHCPQCGLEQVSGKVRFCRACGFSLRGVKELVLPDERAAKAEKTRVETAFNQGLALMLVSLVAAIILTLLQDAHLIPPIYVKIFAAFFILAGLMRMFYPYVISQDLGRKEQESLFYEPDAQIETGKLPYSLPASYSIPVSDFSSRRMDTAEMVQPPSVTEPTTKLLDNRQDTN
jgi:hypothetical protein